MSTLLLFRIATEFQRGIFALGEELSSTKRPHQRRSSFFHPHECSISELGPVNIYFFHNSITCLPLQVESFWAFVSSYFFIFAFGIFALGEEASIPGFSEEASLLTQLFIFHHYLCFIYEEGPVNIYIFHYSIASISLRVESSWAFVSFIFLSIRSPWNNFFGASHTIHGIQLYFVYNWRL